MIDCKEINEYLTYCADNPDEVNEERKLLFKNIVFPLLMRDDVFFDKDTYDKAIAYAESWYYKLFPYQKFIYAFFFIYKDDHPIFRTFVIVMGRGNGKDGLMMPLMNFLQTPIYGVSNYHIDIVANSEDPAENSFKVVYDMLENNERFFMKKFYWNKVEIINKSTHSILRFNTSNAKTKYGKQTGLVLFNELHTYEDFKQINTFSSGLGKIKHPRIVIITTQGVVRDGPLDQTLDVCYGILNGEENVLGYFPFICKIDIDDEIDKPECWIKANPSIEYMPVLKQTIHQEYLEMKKYPSKRVEFITMRMNLPRRNEAITVASWEKILRSSYDDVLDEHGNFVRRVSRKVPNVEGENCICGIDFSDRRDMTTCGFVFNVDGNSVWISRTWICTKSSIFNDIKFPFSNIGQEGYEDFVLTDQPIDIEEVIAWCIEQMKKYRVLKIIMDYYRFNEVKKEFASYGIEVEDKKNPYGLIRAIRNFPAVMGLTIPNIEYLFMDEKVITGNSALFRWSVNNTGIKVDGNGNKNFYKIEPILRKNDTFMAYAAAMSEFDSLKKITLVM